MSFNSNSVATLSNSNDEYYEVQLARRRTETETLLRQQEEKEHLECQAHKEAKIAKQKRLEEEVWRKQEEEEAQQREKKCQRDLAHCLKANRIATIE